MFCDSCGSELNGYGNFCPKCGKAIKKTDKNRNKKKNIKGIFIVLIALCVCVAAVYTIRNAYITYSEKPENKLKKTTKEFVESIASENYEKAEKFVFCDDNIVTGNFIDFAKENLKGAKIEKNKNGYTLVASDKSYKLTSNKSGDKITSDDFYTEYQIKCSSYLTNKPYNTDDFEVLDDGMTVYTIKGYKSHELLLKCGVGLGNESAIPITIKVSTDEEYVVDEITSAYKNGNENEKYDGVYIDENNVVVFDLYYISESYAEKIARIASGAATDMMNAALSGKSFEDFYSGYSDYIFKTDSIKAEYETTLKNKNAFARYMDYVDFTAQKWEYPLEFRYSNGDYVIYETISCTSYKNSREQGVSSDSIYAMFKPAKDSFKFYASADEKSELYRVSDISDDSGDLDNSEDLDDSDVSDDDIDDSDMSDNDSHDLEEWKQAFIEYAETVDTVTDYGFLDIHEDGIPELYIIFNNGTCRGLLNYTKEGDVQLIDALSMGSNFLYSEDKIIDNFSRTGVTSDEVYFYDSSTSEYDLVFSGAYDDGDTDTPNNYRFLIQDYIETTQSEYESKLNEAIGDDDYEDIEDEFGIETGDVVEAIKEY